MNKQAQQRLADAKYYRGTIDGVFGPQSIAALIGYIGENRSDLLSFGRAASAYFPKYKVDTPLRVAHALARWSVETAGFTRMTESLSYRAARLCEVWPSRFPTLASALPFERDPIKLANKTYGGRYGNIGPNDGYRYRGRGPTQLTFKDNYLEAEEIVGLPLVTNPDLVATPDVGMHVACAYWNYRRVWSAADRDDAAGVCKLIQGGSEGLSDQRAFLKRARSILF